MTLALENGIRHAEQIIATVSDAVRQFRSFAEQYHAQERWIAAIETCINQHLSDWGLNVQQSSLSLTIQGLVFDDVRMEQTYRGNFHLLTKVDGQERKFVIGKNKEEYPIIAQTGINNLSKEFLSQLIEKYILKQ